MFAETLIYVLLIDFCFFFHPVFLQFGDSQKLRLVRILRSTVMVRVGGGWVALDEFLVKNDPCRGEFVFYVRVIFVINNQIVIIILGPGKSGTG